MRRGALHRGGLSLEKKGQITPFDIKNSIAWFHISPSFEEFDAQSLNSNFTASLRSQKNRVTPEDVLRK